MNMKTRKTLTFLLLAALTLAACKYDDSALWEQVNQNTEELAAQAARIAALEAWQAETNTNIQALQTLLSTTDYITAVTPVVQDGVEVGYTISFLHTPAITIYHGTKGDKGDTGDTPQIGAAQADDGNWYWTLNGELLTDADGNPIRANGTQGEQGDQGPAGDDAPLPQLATGAKLTAQGITTDSQNNPIAADAIYLSVDGGKTWTRVSGEKGDTGADGPKGDDGEKGDDGDSFFDSVDYTTYDDYVIFTLAENGGTFSVPRYMGISLTFDVSNLLLCYNEKTEIQCTAEGSEDFTPANLFVVAPSGWKTDIALTRAASTAFTLTVTAPADITSGAATGEILVMLDNKKGSTTIGRIFVKAVKSIVDGTTLKAGGFTEGDLATLIGSRTDLTSITVASGTIGDDDWAAIVANHWSLKYLDLAGATYTGTDAASFVYIGDMEENSPLQTIKLPQGVTGIGDYAFYVCPSLTSIDLPASLTNIYGSAFRDCSSLTSVTSRAETPPALGYEDIFYDCTALTDIYVPAGSVEAYKVAVYWSEYADIISAISEP